MPTCEHQHTPWAHYGVMKCKNKLMSVVILGV